MVPINQQKQKLPTRALRLSFSKTGVLQYISHLDLQRTMTRAIIRAEIPVWYTEGFNPKPRLNFSTPLSIGTESHYELMDFRIVVADETMSTPDLSVMRDRLNATLPPEINIAEIYEPTTKFSEILYSNYTIRIEEQNIDALLLENCRAALSAKPLFVLKRTKSGEKDTDISPMIVSLNVSGDHGAIDIRACLTASSESFLNPEYLVNALLAKDVLAPVPKSEREYSIMREDLLDRDLKHFR